MISVDEIPGKAIDAARLAMAKALATDGDGIAECIVAAVNNWPDLNAKIASQADAAQVRVLAEHAIAQWQAWIDAILIGTSFHSHASAELEKTRAELRSITR